MTHLVVLSRRDAVELAKLHAACFAEGWNSEAFEDLLSRPTSLGIGVQSAGDDALTGFGLVQHVGGQAEILTIGVAPDRRCRGIGRDIIRALVRRLGERGAATLTLEVADDNLAARKLYESLGFLEAGRRKNYYRSGRERPVDGVLMKRDLSLQGAGHISGPEA